MALRQVRATLLAIAAFFILPLLLNAQNVLHNDLLKPEASKMIEEMAQELFTKTGVNGYVIATNESFPERFNLDEYSKKSEASMSKPYVLFIFAPFAIITQESEQRGRVGFIPSSDEVKKLYDYGEVRDAAIDIVAVKDKNTPEDKHNIGIVQGFSVLADQIAASKGIELEKTIKDDGKIVIIILQVLVYTGSIFVLWIFLLRPIILRIKNGKQ